VTILPIVYAFLNATIGDPFVSTRFAVTTVANAPVMLGSYQQTEVKLTEPLTGYEPTTPKPTNVVLPVNVLVVPAVCIFDASQYQPAFNVWLIVIVYAVPLALTLTVPASKTTVVGNASALL